MNESEIDKIKPKIKELAEKYDLSLVVLFGSQATGRIHQKSDIDIAVLGAKKFYMPKLMIDFDRIFKRDDIEIVDLGVASPTLMHCVVRDGKALFEKDADTFFNWKLYAIWVWMDTAWLRQLRDKKMIEWARTS